jgi:hypothetical protein
MNKQRCIETNLAGVLAVIRVVLEQVRKGLHVR